MCESPHSYCICNTLAASYGLPVQTGIIFILFFFPLSIQKFLDSVQAQNSRSCSWKYMHCIKKQKSLRQPASADFWVFSSYFLGYVSTFCCINLKQEVENSNICWSWLPETFKFAQLLCFFYSAGGSFLLQINALINLLKKLCLIFFSFF